MGKPMHQLLSSHLCFHLQDEKLLCMSVSIILCITSLRDNNWPKMLVESPNRYLFQEVQAFLLIRLNVKEYSEIKTLCPSLEPCVPKDASQAHSPKVARKLAVVEHT